MKRSTYFFIISILICFYADAITYKPYNVQGALPKKKVTFIVYMAADNSLAPDAEPNIDQMSLNGSNENCNVLVYLSIHSSDQPKVTRKLVVGQGQILQDGPDMVQDSGATQTVIDALAWAHEKFPADHVVVDFWNHGSGALNRSHARSVCYDDSTGNYLTDAKLRQALSYICQHYRNGKKIDVIAFDACLMACVEVMYALQDYADYMVASQETIPADGFNYQAVLAPLHNGNVNMRSFAQHIVATYDAEYKPSTNDYTLSALDLSRVVALSGSIDQVSELFNEILANGDSDSSALSSAITTSSSTNNTSFFESYYMDLLSFYQNVLAQIQNFQWNNVANQTALSLKLKQGITLIKNCILSSAAGSSFAHANGISIYFDPSSIDDSYQELYWTTKYPQWLSFLTALSQD